MAEYIEKKAVIEEIERLENKFTSVEFFAEDLTKAINSLPTKEDTSDTHLLDMLLEAIKYTHKQLQVWQPFLCCLRQGDVH